MNWTPWLTCCVLLSLEPFSSKQQQSYNNHHLFPKLLKYCWMVQVAVFDVGLDSHVGSTLTPFHLQLAYQNPNISHHVLSSNGKWTRVQSLLGKNKIQKVCFRRLSVAYAHPLRHTQHKVNYTTALLKLRFYCYV